MKRGLIIVAVLLSSIPAHADATVVAQGTVTFQFGSDVCSAPMGMAFDYSSGVFALHAVYGPGSGVDTCPVDPFVGDVDGLYTNQGQSVQTCNPTGYGAHFFVSSIRQTGSTFTISRPRTFCNGSTQTDVIVMTVGSSTVSFRRDVTGGSLDAIHIRGTLSRAV